MSDGLTKLTSYAFNLDPFGPDARQFVFGGSGATADLPVHRLVDDGTTVTLEIEYLRNTHSGLIYTPQYSTSPAPGSWLPMDGPETIVPLDQCWQRVTARQEFDAATTACVFAKVLAELP